mgnify:CR=1 FL=1
MPITANGRSISLSVSSPNPLLVPFRNEPPRNFADDQQREAFEGAIRQVRARLPLECPMVIAGQKRMGERRIVSENPCDVSETIARSAAATIEDAADAVQVARRAFDGWAEAPVGERAALVLEIARRLRRRRDEFSAMMVLEAGKTWKEADADTIEAIDFLEYYAREMMVLAQPVHLQPELPGELNHYGYMPLGVGVVIAPWNFPLAIPVGMVFAAIVAGNTVVFKPAEQTPAIMAMLHELALDAGLPRGVFQYLPGIGEEIGPGLVNNPDVDFVTFTGSRAVGLSIIEAAARVAPGQRGVRRVVAEMGGKNAIIVDEDADLDQSIPDILASAFGFAGQKCSACSRVIAIGSAFEPLVKRLPEAARALAVGPAELPSSDIPAVIDADARARIERYIELGASEGREIFRGDISALASRGHYVSPSVFADLRPDARLMNEEIFGPVLGITRAADLDEALRIMNGTEYALTGGIHSRSPRNIEKARRRAMVGNLYINRSITGAIVARQPFGGFRFSGVGSKAGGPDYLKQFLVARSWTENIVRQGFAPLS